MTGEQLRRARRQTGRTQIDAAAALGVSQTYLSLLEKGHRPVTQDLTRKAVRIFGLRPTEVPLGQDLWTVRPANNAELAADLAALKYPGLAHLKPGRVKNPAEVLVAALSADVLESRLVEALPWVVLRYAELNWNVLIMAAKVKNIQNRLGFAVNVARRLAESRGEHKKALALKEREDELDEARLLKEDTLCNNSMTEAEKRWLREKRPAEAEHWRLLTDLSPRTLDHVD